MRSRKKMVVVVMPAYNAGRTVAKTFASLPSGIVDRVILVDDHSWDDTAAKAKKLGAEVVIHPQNRGYGANQKTCYTLALSAGADIVVMVHPDYQYDPRLTGELVRPIIKGRCEIMLGSRIRSRREALAGGMPSYKYFGNRLLTVAENIVLDRNLSEYHTGFRAFDAKVLRKLPFHKFSDDFVFDQEILVSAIREGYRIGEIAVPVKYFAEASSINFWRSARYGLETLLSLVWYVLDRWGLFRAAIFARN